MDIAEQVDFDHPPPCIHRNGFKPAESGDSGIVEPDVDAAEALQRVAAKGLHLFLVRDIGGDCMCDTAQGLALTHGLVQHVDATSGKHEPSTPPSEGLCCRSADTARRVSDDDAAGVVVEDHESSCEKSVLLD
jgi:hypothetical protein